MTETQIRGQILKKLHNFTSQANETVGFGWNKFLELYGGLVFWCLSS
jgi:hypothetical protein